MRNFVTMKAILPLLRNFRLFSIAMPLVSFLAAAACLAWDEDGDGDSADLFVCSFSAESDDEIRYELDVYIHQITALCDSQIEELAGVISPDDVERLRSEHYSWKTNRDIFCADAGRNSSDPLRDLECLSELTEEYFEQRELQLAEEEERAK